MFDDALPADIAVEFGDPGTPSLPLFVEEASIVAAAVEKRRLEFEKGRQCAHAALRRLGLPDAPILSGEQREPLWPAGVVGSITHTRGLCLAAVGLRNRYASLGIDVEPDAPLSAPLAARVATAAELRAVESLPELLAARVVFSAKEAFYKCQFYCSRQFLGFFDVSVTLGARGDFWAELLVNAGPFARGERFSGRWRQRAGFVFTAIHLESDRLAAASDSETITRPAT